MIKNKLWIAIVSLLLLFLPACSVPVQENHEITETSLVPDSAKQTGTVMPLSDAPESSGEEPPSQNYSEFFSIQSVHRMDVELSSDDWQAMKNEPEEKKYYEASITIDGTTIGNAGIRTRGSSSLRAAKRFQSERYPLRIKFDEYVKGQTFLGLDELVLNNSNDDPSFLREYLGYEAFRKLGIEAPYVSFFDLYINGELHGMYVGVEAVDNSYLERVFKSHRGNLYKAEEGASLETGMDLELLEQKKGRDKSKSDISELIRLLNEPQTEKKDLENLLDIDSVLSYFAANTVIHNWDDYAGQFSHNYYFYQEQGKFYMLPWDMNEGFLQTQAYYRESDGARQTISTPITGDVEPGSRPLAEKLLSVPEYYQQYLAHIEILKDWLEGELPMQVRRLKNMVQPSVEQDPTKFFSIDEFERQFSESNHYGLTAFIDERAAYLDEALAEIKNSN